MKMCRYFPAKALAVLLVCVLVLAGCGSGNSNDNLNRDNSNGDKLYKGNQDKDNQNSGNLYENNLNASRGGNEQQDAPLQAAPGENSLPKNRVTEDNLPEDGLMRSLAATVEIESGSLYGSGVIYEKGETGLILVTAAHVLAPGAGETRVIFQDGSGAACSGCILAAGADCAFLVVDYGDLQEGWQEKYGTVEKNREKFDSLECGEGVFLADLHAENELGCRFAMVKESWIYVEDFSQHMMLLSGQAGEGMSGCGVFDEEGCFLGILCGGNEEGELAVLPYSVIASCYSREQ